MNVQAVAVKDTSSRAGAHPCRLCGGHVEHTFVDLGMSPLCESFLRPDQLDAMEPYFPLRAGVCGDCFLVQLNEYVRPEHIFNEYAYFSSYSTSWVAHAKAYCEMIAARLGLGADSLVVETREQRRISAAALSSARRARARHRAGSQRRQSGDREGRSDAGRFLRRATCRGARREGRKADLIAGNNVLAQVPDLNDFVAGMRILLSRDGVITIEFPHLRRLIEENQFDTIYHEHFSYFSLVTIDEMLGASRLSALRCRGAAYPRRLAARLCLRTQDRCAAKPPRCGDCSSASVGVGFRKLATYASFDEQVQAHEAQSPVNS